MKSQAKIFAAVLVSVAAAGCSTVEKPKPAVGSGQGRGNSGVYFMDQYEIQILDCYENKTYADGATGGIYGQHPALVNACRPPGEWQTYDIIFTAPRFGKDGAVLSPAY